MDTVFFILSKVFWAFLRPETLLLLALLWATLSIWRARYHAAFASLGLSVFGLLCIAVLPLADLLIGPLERRFPANPAVQNVSHIVVLGGSEIPGLTGVWRQPQLNEAGERILYGISLANRFPESDLVFTGGGGARGASENREANIAETIFLSAGIAPNRLLIESASRNTAQNARNTFELMKSVPQEQILLVTSAAHMPRAMASFCSAGWRNLVAWPVDFRSGAFWSRVGLNLASNLEDLNKGAKEWVGILAYRLTGRISDMQDGHCGPVAQN